MLKKFVTIASLLALVFVFAVAFVPALSHAAAGTAAEPGYGQGADTPDFSRANGIVSGIGNIVNVLVPLAITIALLVFIWGLATYLLSSGDPEKNEAGKNRMIQGVIALFVIVSIWGIVAWIGRLVGVKQGGGIPTPGVDVTY